MNKSRTNNEHCRPLFTPLPIHLEYLECVKFITAILLLQLGEMFCGLFDDAACISEYIESNGRVSDEYLI
jgi:hypothetical protein